MNISGIHYCFGICLPERSFRRHTFRDVRPVYLRRFCRCYPSGFCTRRIRCHSVMNIIIGLHHPSEPAMHVLGFPISFSSSIHCLLSFCTRRIRLSQCRTKHPIGLHHPSRRRRRMSRFPILFSSSIHCLLSFAHSPHSVSVARCAVVVFLRRRKRRHCMF